MHTLLKTHSQEPMSDFSRTAKPEHRCLSKTGISPRLRQKLLCMHVTSFDWERGGLQSPIKFLDRDSIEYSLTQAAKYDKNEERMALLSLNKGMGLLDIVNGGIYQFATNKSWQQSHYSKSMAAQAGSLRLYSLAYALLREHNFLRTARNISEHMNRVLMTPEGVFRSIATDSLLKLDKSSCENKNHDYLVKTDENGWAIEALASFYEFSGEQSALLAAKLTSKWILSERALSNGGFLSNEHKDSCLRLSDNIAMARAFLQMYRVTTESCYLLLAVKTADFIKTHFVNEEAGFNPVSEEPVQTDVAPQIDENICTSRFFNLLHYYTDNSEYLNVARHGLKYLAIPQVATSRMEEAGILLLDEELSSTPLKIVIVGDKNDREANRLFQTALRSFGWYKVIHWHVSPALNNIR